MSATTSFNESDHPRAGDGKFAAKDAPDSEASLDDADGPVRERWEPRVQVGDRTPWGLAQYTVGEAEGIDFAGTASHGGIKLSPDRNKQVHPAFRRRSAWYEEDDESSIVAYFHADDLAGERAPGAGQRYFGATPDEVRESAGEVLRDYYPDEWAAMTGRMPTAEESSVVDERQWREAHADSFLLTSASRLEDGSLLLTGRRPSDGADGRFIAPLGFDRGSTVHPAVLDGLEEAPELGPDPQEDAWVRPPARTDATLSGLTPTQAARAERDLATWYRDRGTGETRTLRDLIESGHVTGKSADVDPSGRSRYYLTEQTGRSTLTAYPVSASAWKGLAAIPDDRTPVEVARQRADAAGAAMEKAELRGTPLDVEKARAAYRKAYRAYEQEIESRKTGKDES